MKNESQPAGSYVAWKRWREEDFARTSPEDALYFQRELSQAGIASIANLDVGELGFGQGAFAGWCTRNGGRWVGYDVSETVTAWARSAGYRAVDGAFAAGCGDASLDLVIAFDVLEHMDLAAIRAVLNDVRRVLRPGGTLIARLPSGDSPFSGAIFNGDLTHRTLLGSQALRQLARDAGLDVTQLRAPAWPIRGLGVRRSVRRAGVRLVRAAADVIVGRILIGSREAVISPNMVIVAVSK